MTHVDVIKNEWLSGYQVVVARVFAEDSKLAVVPTEEAERYTEYTVRELYNKSRLDARQFVETLHERLHGDYLVASEPHHEAECPYGAIRIALEPANLPSYVSAANGR